MPKLNKVVCWISLVANILAYGFCCFTIIKRKNFTCISMRSPTLLLCNNLGGFLTSTIIILSQIIGKCAFKYISGFYYIFQSLMMFSFLLRCQRIISCCNIKKDERLDIKQFYKKKYLFQEIFYVKVLLYGMLGFLIILIIINFTGPDGFRHPFTLYIIDLDANRWVIMYSEYLKKEMIMWIIINFIEQAILITYAYQMFIKKAKQKIEFELIVYLIIWFIYSNLNTGLFLYYVDKLQDDIKTKYFNTTPLIIVSIIIHYFCLIINGYFPITLSYCYHTTISYHYTPNLMKNLYLFLINEQCYHEFSNFLKKLKGSYSYYLRIYTHIMQYKLGFYLNEENNNLYENANEIYNSYFDYYTRSNNSKEIKINIELNSKIFEKCQCLKDGDYSQDIFDDALTYVYGELNKRFCDFKKTQEYSELVEEINLQSYIQCKMCNTGLINQF